MDKNVFEERLREAGLRPSPVRLMVMRVLEQAVGTMSSGEVERVLETVDRSSIGRALVSMAERGVVHTIDDGSGSMKYELCHHHGDEWHGHEDFHPHFHCRVCGTTYCFDELSIPRIAVPEGFEAEAVNYVLKGVCRRCRDKGYQ